MAEATQSVDTEPMSSAKRFICPKCGKGFEKWKSLRGHGLGAHGIRFKEEDFGVELGVKPIGEPGVELTPEEEEARAFKGRRQREEEAKKFYFAKRQKEREIRKYVSEHPEILDELGVSPRRYGYGEPVYRGEDEFVQLGKTRVYESMSDYYDAKKRAIERGGFYPQPETKDSPEVKAMQEQLTQAQEQLTKAIEKIGELEKQREEDRWDRLDKRLDSIEEEAKKSKGEKEALVTAIKETADVVKTTVTELKPALRVFAQEGARGYRLVKVLERAKIKEELEKRGIEVTEEAVKPPVLEEGEEASGVTKYVDEEWVEEE